MSICYGTINDFQAAISCIKELEKIFTRKELPDVFYVMYFTLCFTTFRAHLRHDSARHSNAGPSFPLCGVMKI